jgi:hypothetical protein
MVKKTQKTSKIAKTTKTTNVTAGEIVVPIEVLKTNALNHDVMLSVLVVSVFINAFILTGWVALQVTSAYNSEVASFLFTK